MEEQSAKGSNSRVNSGCEAKLTAIDGIRESSAGNAHMCNAGQHQAWHIKAEACSL